MGDDREPGKGGRPDVAPVIRAGSLTLAMLGVVSLFLTVPTIINPGGIQCTIARTLIEDANGDDREFNDVDTGGRAVDDIDCDEAVALALEIRLEEDSDRTASVPSASLVRNRGLMSALVGAGQIVGGFMTLGTLQRRWRTTALIFAVLGVVVPVLGLVTVAVLGFVVYALGFSNVARETWPTRPRGSGPT